MPKVVINNCYGGFSVSREGVLLARELSKDPKWGGPCIEGDLYSDGSEVDTDFGYVGVDRTDPWLVRVVEELGDKASGYLAKLKVVDVPDDIAWYIHDYDGIEEVHEEHRSWG